jgi:hypothetical protein
METSQLIGAVAGYISDRGGAPTKTKVLKFLYLLDVESYRRSQTTLTGFRWIFHHYGPWAAEYDEALERAADISAIRLNGAQSGDEGATFVNSLGRYTLRDVFPSVVQELSAKRIIEAWADKPTVQLLDYVYFHTAPMKDAQRGDTLDFATVSGEQKLPHYFGVKRGTDAKEIAKKKRLFSEKMSRLTKPKILPLDPAPPYDEKYWASIDNLENESN